MNRGKFQAESRNRSTVKGNHQERKGNLWNATGTKGQGNHKKRKDYSRKEHQEGMIIQRKNIRKEWSFRERASGRNDHSEKEHQEGMIIQGKSFRKEWSFRERTSETEGSFGESVRNRRAILRLRL
jgi:hypothetical protein